MYVRACVFLIGRKGMGLAALVNIITDLVLGFMWMDFVKEVLVLG